MSQLQATIFSALKWILGIFFILIGITTLFTGSFLGGCLVIVSSLSILPPVSAYLKRRLGFWSNRSLRIVIQVVAMIIGLGINRTGDGAENDPSIRAELTIIKYIEGNKADRSLRTIKKLGEIGGLFGNPNYSVDGPHDGYITVKVDTNSKVATALFNPRIDFIEAHEAKYLKDHETWGTVENYVIEFKVDSLQRIVSKQTFISFSKIGTLKFDNDSVPDLISLIDSQMVGIRNEEIAIQKQQEEKRKEFEKRNKEFEENCISEYDGSHQGLVDYLSAYLHDPDSFEHVETSYKLFNDHAVVVMTYRSKNMLGALVLGTIAAKINLDDCSVIEIIE